VALFGRLLKKPTVITYHCDLRMPPGVLSWLANVGVKIMNNLAALFTQRIVTYTRDYAENSNYLRRYLKKLTVISPPVELPLADARTTAAFTDRFNANRHHPVIGMAARFATEKGVEVLLNALPQVLEAFPDAMVLFAGPYQNIIGEEQYFSRLSPTVRKFEQSDNWRFVGELNPEQMSAFYQNIDLLVLPSLNSTEAFGLVQIEAMMNGKPCVASNLPGVRQPVKRHHMGSIIPIGSAKNLAEDVINILQNPANFSGSPEEIIREYLPDTIAEHYEHLFTTLKHNSFH
jgi:glycosyltransferase involved in cell wall biosynthesis